MVLITTLSSKFNKALAPFLLRNALSLRFLLNLRPFQQQNNSGSGKSGTSIQIIRDNPILDSVLLLPFAQSLISIEVQDDTMKRRREKEKFKEKERRKRNNSGRVKQTWFSKANHKFDDFTEKTWDNYIEPTFHRNSTSTKDEKSSSSSKIKAKNDRLEALESYLKPALIPTGNYLSIMRWQHHHRFIKWVREQYLIAKYDEDVRGALTSYPMIRMSPQLQTKRKGKQQKNDSLLFGLGGGSGSLTQGEEMGYRSSHKKKLKREQKERKGLLPPLPSSRHLIEAFQMQNWTKQRPLQQSTSSTNLKQSKVQHPSQSSSSPNEYKKMELIANQLGGQILTIPNSNTSIAIDIHHEEDISNLSLEDALEVSGCRLTNAGAFNALCEEGNIYEFWTREYVLALALYLLDRFEGMDEDCENVVLELGAGDGILSYFLNEYMSLELEKRRRKGGGGGGMLKTSPTVVATDDGSWSIHPHINVEKLNVSQSLQKYGRDGENSNTQKEKNVIVICSWMPMGTDWTQEIRKLADEYILIGDSDTGVCGHDWYTWGNKSDEEYDDGTLPPSVVDGFQRVNLDDLSKLQFSRFDSSIMSCSHTVSFRKRSLLK